MKVCQGRHCTSSTGRILQPYSAKSDLSCLAYRLHPGPMLLIALILGLVLAGDMFAAPRPTPHKDIDIAELWVHVIPNNNTVALPKKGTITGVSPRLSGRDATNLTCSITNPSLPSPPTRRCWRAISLSSTGERPSSSRLYRCSHPMCIFLTGQAFGSFPPPKAAWHSRQIPTPAAVVRWKALLALLKRPRSLQQNGCPSLHLRGHCLTFRYR